MNREKLFDIGTSVATSALRGVYGAYSLAREEQPKQRPVLFAKENCPFSRRARETLTYLDLDFMVVPCPDHAQKNRERVENLLGRVQVPVLVDSEHEAVVAESTDIEKHLFNRYGSGGVPLLFNFARARQLASDMASRVRSLALDVFTDENDPEQPLELWDFEQSPLGRVVRSNLEKHAITHIRHNTAPGGHRWRSAEFKLELMTPRLKDPNRDRTIHGVDEILAYLDEYYASPH